MSAEIGVHNVVLIVIERQVCTAAPLIYNQFESLDDLTYWLVLFIKQIVKQGIKEGVFRDINSRILILSRIAITLTLLYAV